VKKAGFAVVGISVRAHVEKHNIPQLWSTLGTRVEELEHLASPSAAYGLTTCFDEPTGEFEYVAGFEVERVEGLPEGMGSWQVPEARYAVFTCTLPTMPQAHRYAYEIWLPQSDYQRSASMEFERYDERFDPQDPNSEFEFYIPIE
jgi:AraC family transcriptional regulator